QTPGRAHTGRARKKQATPRCGGAWPRSGHRGRSGYLVPELLAPFLRIAQSRRALEASAVHGDDLPAADLVVQRISGRGHAPLITLVDHGAHRPPVLALTRQRVPLIQARGAGLELDERVAGVVEARAQVVADDRLVVLRPRSVVERRDLLARQRRG